MLYKHGLSALVSFRVWMEPKGVNEIESGDTESLTRECNVHGMSAGNAFRRSKQTENN